MNPKMNLPVTPPVKPMLAKAIDGIPEVGDLAFEPKWDGFRCIVFRDGDDVFLGSRNERPLTRYFPELIEPLKDCLPERCVVDGEIIVTIGDHLGFDALQQRIHPAESRINRLAEETPAALATLLSEKESSPASAIICTAVSTTRLRVAAACCSRRELS